MDERGKDRRSLPSVGDRRSKREQPVLKWDDAPAIPGTIRPGVNEAAPVERRRYPDSGME